MKSENKTFTITCTMKERWIPHFLAMLKYVQFCGNVGMSRRVSIYADGDGDFHPKFEWDKDLPADVKPVRDNDGCRTYDAG